MEKSGEHIGDIVDIELIIDGYSGVRKDIKERSLIQRMLADMAAANES